MFIVRTKNLEIIKGTIFIVSIELLTTCISHQALLAITLDINISNSHNI